MISFDSPGPGGDIRGGVEREKRGGKGGFALMLPQKDTCILRTSVKGKGGERTPLLIHLANIVYLMQLFNNARSFNWSIRFSM